MALDLYVKEDIRGALRSVYVAQQPGPEGCRTLVAVALAFGLVKLPAVGESPEDAVRDLLVDRREGRLSDGR